MTYIKITEHKDRLEIRNKTQWRILIVSVVLAIAIIAVANYQNKTAMLIHLYIPAFFFIFFISTLIADIEVQKGRIKRYALFMWFEVPKGNIFKIYKNETKVVVRTELNKMLLFSFEVDSEAEMQKAIARIEKYYGDKIHTERAQIDLNAKGT